MERQGGTADGKVVGEGLSTYLSDGRGEGGRGEKERCEGGKGLEQGERVYRDKRRGGEGGGGNDQRRRMTFLLTTLILFFCEQVASDAISDEKRLIKHLLDDYETVGIVGRPVYNQSQTINVEYGLALIQILDLDEKNQVLTTNVWSRYVWMDILLAWNPDDFGGVDKVRVPIGRIWSPDIVLYNYADQRIKEQREAMAVVSNDGSVLWIPPAIFLSTCSIDITHFPFDVQTCHLKFGSWTYDGYKLDINFYANDASVDISDYVESNEWELIGYPAKKNVKYYPCCSEPFPDLTFTIQLKRIAAFYSYIIVLPCVLLSFLTLVIFWLPPESPAKMMLGMNVFVAFFVLLLLLADNTPPASTSIPLIGAYFCMNMMLITLSTFLAIIVINTHIRGDRKNKVPVWLKKVTIDGLARFLCMSEYLDKSTVTVRRADQIKWKEAEVSLNENNSLSCRSLPRNGGTVHQFLTKPSDGIHLPQQHLHHHHRRRLIPSITSAATPSSPDTSSPSTSSRQSSASGFYNAIDNGTRGPGSSLEVDIREIRALLRSFMGRLSEKDAQAKVTKEWRIVARVFDRLFFFVYCSTIIVSLATIFPRA